jgi:transposase
LAKNVFQVHGIYDSEKAVPKRKLRCSEVLPIFAGMAPALVGPALVGIEACHTAHCWGRVIAALWHDVRLMPPLFVKPYIDCQKNDAVDAVDRRRSAKTHTANCANQICGSAGHCDAAPDARLVDSPRSSVISAIRAPFAELDIVVEEGLRNVERLLALLETAGDQRLLVSAAEMLGIYAAQRRRIAEQVKEVEVKLLAWHRVETSRRLQSVPRLGPITASAIVTTVGDPKQFKSGRQFAAWLGLVP